MTGAGYDFWEMIKGAKYKAGSGMCHTSAPNASLMALVAGKIFDS
jgi:hypothetical protein